MYNRISTQTQTIGSVPYILKRAYDKTGNVTKTVYPSGKIVKYGYDLDNRMTQVKIANTVLADNMYDTLDRRTLRSYTTGGAAQQSAYVYDIADQLTNITNTITGGAVISKYTYAYNPNGNRKKQTRKLAGQVIETTNYQYNTIDELIGTTGSQVNSYDYDPVGNREVANGVSYTPNTLNQYAKVGAVM